MTEPSSTESIGFLDSEPGPPRPLVPGSTIGGRYEVRGLLGRGGFALVYRAWDRELRREVALKVLRADRLAPATLTRLRREATVARDAASERLVRIFDIGHAGGTVFLTMELVEGGSLDRRLAQGPLPVPEAIRLARQMLEGLQALHVLKIVHRDVKPGNVLLTASGDVKLADFGLARHLEGDETRATRHDGLLGTLQYVAPECVLGEEAEPRSDLYSLGVVLYEMLTGRLPFEGRSGLGTLLGHLRTVPPDPRDLRPEVPGRLASVVRRLLARRPDKRYASAEAALAALASDRSARPLRPPTWRLRGLAAACLLALLAAALAIRAWTASRFSHLVDVQGTQETKAVSRDGRVLWSAPDTGPSSFAVARLHPGGPKSVVGILRPQIGPEAAHILSVLDPQDGHVRNWFKLPQGVDHFPGFANTFFPTVRAKDLDGDGGDEILVSYTHSPLWPSYTVLYEPLINRSRILFVGSGHHRFTDARDLDGDGRLDLLLTGINNRMGWYTAIAAVRVVPWVNDTSSSPGWDLPCASSPDESYSASSDRILLWYALGPNERFIDLLHPSQSDDRKRTLTFSYFGGVHLTLGFNGLPVSVSSPLPPQQRQELHRQAYRDLAQAERLTRAGSPAAGLGPLARSLREAGDVGDPYLGEWMRRVQARTLIAAGRLQEGEASSESLARTSTAVADVCFEAGKALHLAGAIRRAIPWYLRALDSGGSRDKGRGKWELVEGAVLALIEQGRPSEALGVLDRYSRTYGQDHLGEALRDYVEWRLGGRPNWRGLQLPDGSPDLMRYWRLEFRLRDGDGLAGLLRDVGAEVSRSSESDPQLLSLQAEILSRLGRGTEAQRVSVEALGLAEQQRRYNTGVEAHFDLIAERAARLGGAGARPGTDRSRAPERLQQAAGR